jgi:hypothetical protein
MGGVSIGLKAGHRKISEVINRILEAFQGC